jgi:RNA polymerase sporulation-specific sigma factor
MVRKETRKLYLIGADEEDLIQEGMIGLFKAIRDYNPDKDTDFALFANVCIVRQLCSAIRASNRQKHTPLNTYISLYAPIEQENTTLLQDVLEVDSDNPEQRILDKERVDELLQQIDEKLSPLEKKVLTLYIDGYNYEVIGEQLGKSKKAVDNAIQRVRTKLSKMR